MATWPAFLGGSNQNQSPITDQEDLINWYLERSESSGATSPWSLYPTPGVEALSQTPNVGGRANFTCVVGGVERWFGVSGNTLYEFDANGAPTSRGTMATDANPATICTNGDGGGELFITSGDHGYCYTLATNVLTEVLTSGATQGGMLYGYFVAFDRTQSRIRISELFDGQTWDVTQYQERTIGADPWQAMYVTAYGQIVLPGGQTGEVWYNSGAFPFPFQPDPSGLFADGIAATFSIQEAQGGTVWLATNANGSYRVVQANGYTPQRISTHAVERALAGYVRLDDAIGQVYEEEGHIFYLLTFPTANVTWAYDFATQRWTKFATWISEDSAYHYWRPVFHAFAFGRHTMLDRESNVVYRLSNDLSLDVESRPIRRLRRTPAVFDGLRPMFFQKLALLVQTGVGTVSGQGEHPQFMMRISNDGGRSWGNERTASIGRMGAYSTLVTWWQLGMARAGRVFEITCSDPVPYRITAADLTVVGQTREAA